MQCFPFEAERPDYYPAGLSPRISEFTLAFHYDGIYLSCIEKLNSLAEQNPRIKNIPLERLTGSSSEDIRYYAGAVYNHSIFFSRLTAESRDIPQNISSRIDSSFGSFETFARRFTEASVNFRGAGYAWLCEDMSGRLRIGVTSGQNTPEPDKMTPLLCCDLWEHSYYLDYQYKRGDYINAWLKLADWEKAESSLRSNRRRG